MTRVPGASGAFARTTDVADFGWAPSWLEAPLPNGDDRPACVLVFDDRRIGPVLCEELRRRGHHVVRVVAGDAFESRGDEYALAPARDAYERLVLELVRIGKTPARVVHLWLTGPTSGAFADHEAGFESVSHLCRALGARAITCDIAVFTSGALQVADEPVPHPSRATVLGPVRVVPREIAGISIRMVDLEAEPEAAPRLRERIERAIGARIAPRRDAAADHLARIVCDEVAGGASPGVFAYRGGTRYEERFAPLRLEEAPPDELGLRERGTYVVAGLGTLGLAVAELLAEHARANLVLVDRDEPPSGDESAREPACFAAIARMKQSGSEVLVLGADLASAEQVEHALRLARDRFGPIHGAIHAAGHANRTEGARAESDAVLSPKVFETMALGRAIGDEPLDFFVLSSSVSTAVGPPGAIDDVAGSAFVEAYARSRRGHNTFTVAIAWGPLGGARGLTSREAAGALGRVLAGERRPVIAVSSIDLAAWNTELGEARPAPPSRAPPPPEPEASFQHLVALGEDRSEPPFFFVCFDGVARVRPLARALRRRVYALRTRSPFESIEGLARVYADEITRARPDGPYLLGAVHEAGALGFETARQLRASGARVALLAMIGARAPVVRDVRGRIDFHVDRMKKRGLRHAAEWTRARVEREAARVRAFLDDGVAGAARRALDRYEWMREPGRIALFRVGPERAGVGHGWDHWAEAVDVFELRGEPSGDVEGIAAPLTTRALARGLDDAVERALASAE